MKIDQSHLSIPIHKQRRFGSLRALLLSLIFGVLGVFILLSILDTRATVFASHRKAELDSSASQFPDSTAAPATNGVSITKRVEPPNPHTGEVVSICFIISGLRPSRLDVALTQDVSLSMLDLAGGGSTQTRLAASQAAASAFVNFLPSADRTAVISYSQDAQVAQPLTTTKSAVTMTINGLTALGGTNIGEGISVSHKELITSPRFMTETVKTIILLSDGIATSPINTATAKAYALRRAAAAASDNIKIYTIGFGDNADEDLLQSIAITGGGKYFFAPDGDVLKTIYFTIALELHNLTITDILTPGVETSCSQWPDGQCIVGPGGVTTLTFPISNSLLISDPAVFCFTATANLDPDYEGPTNLPGSGICYRDTDGQTVCTQFDNPVVIVGGRKITGNVFYDVNANGKRDVGEAGAAGVVVRTSTDVTAATDVAGSYVLRTPNEPTISVTVEMPAGYAPTTPIAHRIPAITGTYPGKDFGVYGGACVQGRVFDDANANGQDDGENGLAEARITASDGTTITTGDSGAFTVCAPANTGPITIAETDPAGYTSTVAINGVDARVVDSNTLRIDNPVAGNVYSGNKFGDLRLTSTWSIYLPVFLQNHPLPSIINGGFELGWIGWSHGGELDQTVLSTNPRSGSFSALLGNPAYECEVGVPVGSAWMEQAFYVPPTDNPRLSFSYNIYTQDKNPFLQDEFDSFDVRINDLLTFRSARKLDPYGCDLDDDQADLSWQDGEIDLSSYRGQHIMIRFENRSYPDGWFNTWTYVDDVEFLP